MRLRAIICAGLWMAAIGAAAAQEQSGGLLRSLGLTPETSEPKDFVRQSRTPGEKDYISTQQPDAPRGTRLKTPDEIRAAEAELDAARAKHDRIVKRKPKDVGRSAAGPERKKKKKTADAPLALTPAAKPAN